MDHTQLKQAFQTILQEFHDQVPLRKGQVLVIGCSTSEVMGEKIGTAGTIDTAELIYEELRKYADKSGVSLAFQCCEHLNRAIVIERETAETKNLDEVTVVPVRKAGGAMATHAYHRFLDPVIVEHIKADAGIDIGDTFIGMHLKHVAVPVRVSVRSLGHAHVTLARTRPKLIGGNRAVYE
ncbi:TIGR01440 family protein [Rossellomorea marisflavi]|uniref:TIGR01440 family protein n=1 Tax=Rossellomorea marisflavi TaxID=189381 RepID=UPI00279DE052|nr:TIGR01440 family protein [Rossellomorea marisflavi]UTE73295.1 TIGR01440 family protein [Rossellomorea marisflavi]